MKTSGNPGLAHPDPKEVNPAKYHLPSFILHCSGPPLSPWKKKSNITSNINLHITKLLREKAVFFSNFVYFCTCPDMPIWWYMCTYVFFWSRLFGLVAIANVGKVYYGWIMGPKVNPISSKANLTFDMIRTSYVIL